MSGKYGAECPFCASFILRPEATKTDFGEILSGRCTCGAVYVCDPTGHNAGEAYMEAMALAKGDWDLQCFDGETDYQTFDMDYDLNRHQRVYTKGMGSVSGKLIFVKLRKPGIEEPASGTPQPIADGAKTDYGGGRVTDKKTIRKLLEEKAYVDIAGIALQDKSVIRHIISLAYDKEDVITWRAIEAMGIVARALSGTRVDILRDTIRRLLWSMGEESGGIGWSAAEMLGEIIRSDPEQFSDIIPIVWSFREEDMFRAGIVWAMGRIAQVRPDLVDFIKDDICSMLSDKNPAVRGYAVCVFGILGADKVLDDLRKLLGDRASLSFYENGELTERTVAAIVEGILNSINKNSK